MAKLKDGFYKQTAEAIGSDLHVLLAGGGSKALSDFAYKSDLTGFVTGGPYLPLAGGTMTGSTTVNSSVFPAFVLNNTNSSGVESGIRFEMRGSNKGYVGYHNSYGTYIWNSTASRYLCIADDGKGYLRSTSTAYELIHSGNLTHQVGDWNSSVLSVFKSSENQISNAPTQDFCYGVHLRFHRDTANYFTDLVTTLYSDNLYYRRHTESGYSSWKRLAFTSDIPSIPTSLPANGGDADTVDGYHAHSFAKYYYSSDSNADTIDDGIHGGKLYGASVWPLNYYAFLSVGYSNYKMQFNARNNVLYFRAGTEDGLSTMPWVTIIHSGNIGSQSVNYATSAGSADSATSASYSRNLLGRNTNGSDYGATAGNLVFAEWNTHSDSRWYLKADGYETRVGYANGAGNADTVDNLHASDLFRAYGTLGTGNSYDSDWGQSIVTFDPVVNGTYPESNPNVTILNLGNNYGRRKQLAFNYNNNNIYFRRRLDSSWQPWVRLALASEIPSVTNYYWADQLITNSAKSNATPTFGNVNIKSGTDAGLAIYTSDAYSRIRFYNAANENKATIHYFASAYSGYTFAKDTLNIGGITTIGAWNNPTMYITQNTNTSDTSGKVGIGTTSPENKLDINGIQQIYQRGNDNTAFKDLLLIKQQNSTEAIEQDWTVSNPTFGIGFRRYWTSGSSPYGETTCAGIYTTVSTSWRGGLIFRTKNNTTQGGTHDTTALRLRPDGHAIFGSSIETNGPIYTIQPSSNRRSGIIGSYDPNRAAAIWSMGSAYQIAADGTTLGNLYGAAYVYYGSGYTFGAGKSGGHSFVWAQNGTPYVALGDGIWTKNHIETGSYLTFGIYGARFDSDVRSSWRTSIYGNTTTYSRLRTVRTDATITDFSEIYGSGLTWATGDTHGYLSVSYSNGKAWIGGGSGNALSWSTYLVTGKNIGSQSVNYATSAGSSATLSGGSVATWGTLTAANGYTNVCTWDTGNTTGAFSLAGKGGQMSLQLDGFFYQNEGKYLVLDTNNYASYVDGRYVNVTGDTMTGNLTVPSLNSYYLFKTTDIAEGAANLGTLATPHTITFFRNGIMIPYKMDNANDGGMIRTKGASESDCVFEMATWDDSGDGETIQFNYYSTTSQLTPTYSNTVPKVSGTLLNSGNWPSYIGGYGYVMKEYTIDATGLDLNTWYPVTMTIGACPNVRIEVRVSLNSGSKPSWSTHGSGFSVRKIWEVNGSGWGTNTVHRTVFVSDYAHASTDPVRGMGDMGLSSTEYVYVRGGGRYYFYTSHNVIPYLRTSTYVGTADPYYLAISPTTTAPGTIAGFLIDRSMYASHFYENSDIKLKENINLISSSDNIPLLKEFNWKSDGKHSYGLIAQELEAMGYSELVEDSGDHKTVNYSAALSLIVGKLQVKIKELEKEIEILKNKN